MEEKLGPMFNPPHPGAFITTTYLEPLGISARTLANALGVAPSSLTRILNGFGGISAEMALRLEAVLGRSATSWLKMQELYDLDKARTAINNLNLERLELLVPA